MNKYEFYIKYKVILNSKKVLFNVVKMGNIFALFMKMDKSIPD